MTTKTETIISSRNKSIMERQKERRESDAEKASKELLSQFNQLRNNTSNKIENWIVDNIDWITLLGGVTLTAIGGRAIYNHRDEILNFVKKPFKSNNANGQRSTTGLFSKFDFGGHSNMRSNKSGIRSNKRIIKDELAKEKSNPDYKISNIDKKDNGDLLIKSRFRNCSAEDLYQDGHLSKSIIKRELDPTGGQTRYDIIKSEKLYDDFGNVKSKKYYNKYDNKFLECDYMYDANDNMTQKVFKDPNGNVLSSFNDVVYENNRIKKMSKVDLNGSKIGDVEYIYSDNNAQIPKEIIFTNANNKCVFEIDEYGYVKKYIYNGNELINYNNSTNNYYEDLMMNIDTKSLKNMSPNDITICRQVPGNSGAGGLLKNSRHGIWAESEEALAVPYSYCRLNQRPVTVIALEYYNAFSTSVQEELLREARCNHFRIETISIVLDGMLPEKQIDDIKKYLNTRKLDDIVGSDKKVFVGSYDQHFASELKLKEIVLDYIKTMGS